MHTEQQPIFLPNGDIVWTSPLGNAHLLNPQHSEMDFDIFVLDETFDFETFPNTTFIDMRRLGIKCYHIGSPHDRTLATIKYGPASGKLFSNGNYCIDLGHYRRFYNNSGELHRTDGPSVTLNDGCKVCSKAYHRNGKPHYSDGPARIFLSEGIFSIQYWIDGEIPISRDGYLITDKGMDYRSFPSAVASCLIRYNEYPDFVGYILSPDELTLAILRYS